MKILIVDDNTGMRKFMQKILTPFADEIFQCEDGFYALDLYRKIKPDWILMDIKMEKLDGISATRIICKFFPLAKIIIVTDYDDTMLKEKALQAGAKSFVLKENIFEVIEVIRWHKSTNKP